MTGEPSKRAVGVGGLHERDEPPFIRRLFEGKNLGKQLLKLTDPPLPVV